MTKWWISRVGGTYEDDDKFNDIMALTAADVFTVDEALRYPILRGRIEINHETGGVRVTEITHNLVHIPADNAVTILLGAHNKVEGCDDGEVAALPVELDQFLGALFEDETAKQIARMLTQAAHR